MRAVTIIIIILFSTILKAQSIVFKEANYIRDFTGMVEKEFIIKMWNDDIYNNLGINYRKVKISYFGEFYVAKVGNLFFSSLGSVEENNVDIWLEDGGNKEKMFVLNKEKQDLGYPFRGYRAYYNLETSNGLQIYDIVKIDCSSEDEIPFELKTILVLKGAIYQLILREKQSERCFYTFEK